MHAWFAEEIVAKDKLPLFLFLAGFLVAFLAIRTSVRLIRAQVRWWPGNITPGGLHIHHVVFGVVTMAISGVWMIAIAHSQSDLSWGVLASFFGIGLALVLDEFALILHLEDVYWQEAGRSSIDAVFVAIAATSLLLLGMAPMEWTALAVLLHLDIGHYLLAAALSFTVTAAMLLITLLKGKLWTGLLGLFVTPVLLIGAIRIGRPGSPWARWRYTSREKKMRSALFRERRIRRPVVQAKIFVQEFLAGSPSVPTPASVAVVAQAARVAAIEQLDREVIPAPAPEQDWLRDVVGVNLPGS